MIALLSPLFGILAGILPTVLTLIQRRMELKYQIQLAQLKIDAATKGMELNVQAQDINAIVTEGANLRAHDASIDGGQFINTLRASIRPVITYAFYFMFVTIKLTAGAVMVAQGVNTIEILNAVWDTHTAALFGAVMGFWFGSRAVTKLDELLQNRLPATTTVTKR